MAVLAMVLGVLGGAAAMFLAGAVGGDEPDRARIEAIVRDYILEHPEIIPQAIERLQQREAAAAVETHREALETPFAGAWAGAEDGEVTLVEFYDYACVYCRASRPDIERLLAEEDDLKIVYRELPVLGPMSLAAAEASLAAARHGDFNAFHDLLFELGRPDEAKIARARAAAGVSEDEVEAIRRSTEARAEIEKNMELANAIGSTGTPTWVVGDQVLHGAVGYERLKEAVEQARSQEE